MGPHDGLVMVQFSVFAQVVLATEGLLFRRVGIFTVVVVGGRNEKASDVTQSKDCALFLKKRGSHFALRVSSQRRKQSG